MFIYHKIRTTNITTHTRMFDFPIPSRFKYIVYVYLWHTNLCVLCVFTAFSLIRLTDWDNYFRLDWKLVGWLYTRWLLYNSKTGNWSCGKSFITLWVANKVKDLRELIKIDGVAVLLWIDCICSAFMACTPSLYMLQSDGGIIAHVQCSWIILERIKMRIHINDWD